MPKRRAAGKEGTGGGSRRKSSRLNNTDNSDSNGSDIQNRMNTLSLSLDTPPLPPQLEISNNSTQFEPQPSFDSSYADRNGNQSQGRHALRLAEASKLIPEYNGENLGIGEFIRLCSDIETLIDPLDKPLFVRFVRSRVTGKASKHIESQIYERLDQMFDDLKRAFSPSQNLSRVQAELSSLTQSIQEPVVDFGLKIKQHLSRLIDLIKRDFDARTADGMIEGTRKLAIQRFIQGLNKRIASHLILKTFNNIEDAIDMAMQYEESFRDLDRLHGSYRPKPGYINVDKRNTTTSVKVVGVSGQTNDKLTNIRCYNCNEEGHIARNCDKRKDQRESGNNYRNSDKTCYNCGKPGHVRSQCRANIICRYCQIAGHIEKYCRKKRAGEVKQKEGNIKESVSDKAVSTPSTNVKSSLNSTQPH